MITPSQATLQGKPAESPKANCPILASISRINGLAQDIQHTMRQLRRDLERCKDCPDGPQCPILQEYQAIISQAIQEVFAELESNN